LLVLEDDHLAFALAEVASTSFFQDYMTPDFDVVSKIMGLIMVLIKATDAKLYAHLEQAGVQPFFATSWLITWFSHDVKKISDVARIFDALLCSHPLFSLYICAAVRPSALTVHTRLLRLFPFAFLLLYDLHLPA
jgi:hypothetical protein